MRNKEYVTEKESRLLAKIKPQLLAEMWFDEVSINTRHKAHIRVFENAILKEDQRERLDKWFNNLFGKMESALESMDQESVIVVLDCFMQKDIAPAIFGERPTDLRKVHYRMLKKNFKVSEIKVLLDWFDSMMIDFNRKKITKPNRLIIISGPEKAGRPLFYGKSAVFIGKADYEQDLEEVSDAPGYYIKTPAKYKAVKEFTKGRLESAFQDLIVIRGDFDLPQIEEIVSEARQIESRLQVQIEVMDDFSFSAETEIDTEGDLELIEQMSRALDLKTQLKETTYSWAYSSLKNEKKNFQQLFSQHDLERERIAEEKRKQEEVFKKVFAQLKKEGNSLTFKELRVLILQELCVDNKPLSDHLRAVTVYKEQN